jgi:hypothetical protein
MAQSGHVGDRSYSVIRSTSSSVISGIDALDEGAQYKISPTLAVTWCVANSHARSCSIVVPPRSATYAPIAA